MSWCKLFDHLASHQVSNLKFKIIILDTLYYHLSYCIVLKILLNKNNDT